ncbi:MAG: flavodoxin family protein [Bacillota bacterium]|jgi:flavodoxin
MKALVVFYSLEGHTKLLAHAVAKAAGADVLEIRPKKDIPSKGFMKFFQGGGQVIRKVKPEIHPLSKDPSGYDLLFIGTPVWVGRYAPALRTFLSQVRLKDKKIVLFAIHRGGPGNVFKHLRKSLEGNIIVDEQDFNEKKGMDKNVAEVEKWAQKVVSAF